MLNQQNSDRGEVNKGEKGSIQLVIPCGNPAKPFELLEEALNQMALFIQPPILPATNQKRHLVENLFLKLKNNRRFATRYEKKALYFRAVVCLAGILVWLL